MISYTLHSILFGCNVSCYITLHYTNCIKFHDIASLLPPLVAGSTAQGVNVRPRKRQEGSLGPSQLGFESQSQMGLNPRSAKALAPKMYHCGLRSL